MLGTHIASKVITPDVLDKVAPVVNRPDWMAANVQVTHEVAPPEPADNNASPAGAPLDPALVQPTRLWPRVGIFDKATGQQCMEEREHSDGERPCWQTFIRRAELLLPESLVTGLFPSASKRVTEFYLFGEQFRVVFSEFGMENAGDDTQKRLLAQGKFRHIVMITTRQLVVAGMFWNSSESFWDFLLWEEQKPEDGQNPGGSEAESGTKPEDGQNPGGSEPESGTKTDDEKKRREMVACTARTLKVNKSAVWLMQIVHQLLFWGY